MWQIEIGPSMGNPETKPMKIVAWLTKDLTQHVHFYQQNI